MHPSGDIVFFGAALVLLSIFAGMLTNRFGAPLLLVFLLLGMLIGEDGPVGIRFDDFELAYLVGSVALAVVLFDGGLRTHRDLFRLAAAPAILLSTVGVVATAAVIGLVAYQFLGFAPIEALLVGSIIGSTDAAAVFFLLNVRGMEIQKRVRATLEVESGLNDPMAIFLTVACVAVLTAPAGLPWHVLALSFAQQMVGGAVIGLAGGFALVAVVNRIEIAAGLYPILAVSWALAVFGGAQAVGASGFLAIYLVGIILGNRRHRAAQLINRFQDGLAWLSQIVMFLLLGLLVTPSKLIPDLTVALTVAVVLILVARPAAVALCLWPFRFSSGELGFIAWVGLRGAVPIFLATVPVLAGLPAALTYFNVAFVVVLTSLVIQGWTIAPAARRLGLELPPAPEPANRQDLDMVTGFDRDLSGYRVAAGSPALLHSYAELPLPRRSRVVTVIRDGTVMDRSKLARLEAGDYVLAVAPSEQKLTLDRLFARPPQVRRSGRGREVFGEFALDGSVPVGSVADFYGFNVTPEERLQPVGAFIARRLRHAVIVGDRLRVGAIELVVQEMNGGEVRLVGIELEPAEPPLVAALNQIRRWLKGPFRKGA